MVDVVPLMSLVGSCVAVLPAWRTAMSVWHMCPCSGFGGDVLVVVLGGSTGQSIGVVVVLTVSSFVLNHASPNNVRRRTPGMV
jgi:hypothetical protein